MNRYKLLIIGGLPDDKHKLHYGGATILMKNFIEYLTDHNIKHKFIQTNKYSNLHTGKLNKWKCQLYFITSFLFHFWKYDTIMFNFSNASTISVFPYLCKLCKIFPKKVVLRKFGGSLDIVWSQLNEKKKNKLQEALNISNLILLETKSAINFAQKLTSNKNIVWFPNVRERMALPKTEFEINNYKRKFVFISHIKKEKGVNELIECFKQLPNDYTLDFYGPLIDYSEKELHGINYKYQGVIPSTKVFSILKNYDCLILPTYWKGEGYPGIIIEAFSLGIPCIATHWGGIPEIIDHRKNGIIIKPQQTTAIVEAIKWFDKANRLELSRNAIKSFDDNFNSETVNSHIINIITNL